MKKDKTKAVPAAESVLPEAEEAEEKTEEAAAESGEGAAPETNEDAVRRDVELFHSLFPEADAKSIPQEVWDKVEAGQELTASYALYLLRKEREEARIRRVNEENAAAAPPRIRHDGTDGTYFSPEAVKKMTQAEVRKNYDQILKSMDHWN